MILDGIAPEITSQAPGPAADSAVGFPSSASTDIISPQPVTEPQVAAAEVTPSQESSLKEIYAGHAARYRELGRKQFDGVLSVEERREREDLNQMAGFGLFEANLLEDQLKAKDAAYKALIEAEAMELKDPQASAERYRSLGRKSIESGLTDEEIKEYNRLKAYANRGKFKFSQAA